MPEICREPNNNNNGRPQPDNPTDSNNNKNNAMPLDTGLDARSQAGYPEALSNSIHAVSEKMGLPIVSVRVGNSPRIDLPKRANKAHSISTKPMAVKTKTTSVPGPLKGLIAERQDIFGRKNSVPITPGFGNKTGGDEANFVDCPVSLRQMLAYTKNGELKDTFQIISGPEEDGSIGHYMHFSLKAEEQPKGFGEYKKSHGKNKLKFKHPKDIQLTYVIKLNDEAIKTVPLKEKEKDELNHRWKKTVKINQASWWKEEYGNYAEVLDRYVPLQIEYRKNHKFHREHAKVLANEHDAIVIGDCDLFAVSPSQAFLKALASELQQLFMTPLNLNNPEDCTKMLFAVHELRIALLKFNINKATKNKKDSKKIKALEKEINELLELDFETMLESISTTEDWKSHFGNITGIITPFELEFNLRVNKEFEKHGIDHIEQFLHHGPENRNPGDPSPIDEPILHFVEGEAFLSHDEKELASFFLQTHADKKWFTHIHPKWDKKHGWGKIAEMQTQSDLNEIVANPTPVKTQRSLFKRSLSLFGRKISAQRNHNNSFSPNKSVCQKVHGLPELTFSSGKTGSTLFTPIEEETNKLDISNLSMEELDALDTSFEFYVDEEQMMEEYNRNRIAKGTAV